MGDQIGTAVTGALCYVPFDEFERVLALPISPVEKTAIFATLCRINALYMIARAGSGHIGSSFSSMEIMSWFQCNELRMGIADDPTVPRDVFFSSKGHDAPALYSTLIGVGKLPFELIHKLRRHGGLPGHPDVATPNIVANTGSLGMGVSKAKGIIFANRLLKRSGNVFVLTGDGELQEGQFWESLLSAANHKLHELTVIVDHNKLQSDTLVSKVSDLGDLVAKFAAFGWYVRRCDGNSVDAFSAALADARSVNDKPKAIIADTVKGKGVSFMEHTSIDSDVEYYKFHSGAPSEGLYQRALTELIGVANAQLESADVDRVRLETVVRPAAAAAEEFPQRLIHAYSSALVEQARRNDRIVALDADLILDTGLIPFRKEFPERFFECGIAEQDMVSVAGSMALQGLIPIVHSFACFLSARPNEQIYNNATESTKIVYVGSLAGILPGGPGHSHQGVRDISALGAVPGLTMVEPCSEAEVSLLLDWCINQAPVSSYLRLMSVPWSVPYSLPADYKPQFGRGVALTEGRDAILIAYGPLMLKSVFLAADLLQRRHGLRVRVMNLPWLNHVDREWLMQEANDCEHVFSFDNHYSIGGQGARISNAIASSRCSRVNYWHLGLDTVPVCGSHGEVLAAHGFDAEGVARFVSDRLIGRKES